MVKKTKKNEKNVAGNLVIQELHSTNFIKNWESWVKACEAVGNLGMEGGGDLYEFLQAHVTSKRPKSKTQIGEGSTKILDAIANTLMAKNVIGKKEIDLIKKFYDFLKDQEGGLYDPANIKFTEKTRKRGRVTRERTVYGHWRTEWFVENNKKIKGAVDSSWYDYAEGAAEPPPHLALYSTTSTKYSKPKGLMYILEEAIAELEKVRNHVEIRVMRRAGRAMELDQVKQFLEKLTVGNASKMYFNEGKMRTKKIRELLATKVFNASPNQEALLRDLSGVSEEEVAGDIATFEIDVTELVIERMFEASKRKKAGGYHIYGNRFDKRPASMKKSWMDYLWVGE
tara:strand:- start:658 stop:1680 length:1023 start_codon:yes stop_codon:yes gene_type:complete